MKVFMYDETIINLAAVEKITTCTPDRRTGMQCIRFQLRGNDSERIHVPTVEIKKILEEIFNIMRED